MPHRLRGPGRDLLLLKRPRDAKAAASARSRPHEQAPSGKWTPVQAGTSHLSARSRISSSRGSSGGIPVTAAIIPEPTSSHHGNTAHTAKT